MKEPFCSHHHLINTISISADAVVPTDIKLTIRNEDQDRYNESIEGSTLVIRPSDKLLQTGIRTTTRISPEFLIFGQSERPNMMIMSFDQLVDKEYVRKHFHLILPAQMESIDPTIEENRAIKIPEGLSREFSDRIMLIVASDHLRLEFEEIQILYLNNETASMNPIFSGNETIEDTSGRWINGNKFRTMLTGENQYIEFLLHEGAPIDGRRLKSFGGLKFQTLDFRRVIAQVEEVIQNKNITYTTRVKRIEKIIHPYARLELV